MLRDINLLFLVLRVLLFTFFLALSFRKPITQQALLIIPSTLYLLFSLYVFRNPGKLLIFKNYGDLFFIPLLVYISGQKEALLALFPFIALYTSRKIFEGMLFLWWGVGFVFFFYGQWGFYLLPAVIALHVASLHPDLVEALRKERYYVRNLRKSYRELTSQIGRLEKELQSVSTRNMLLESLQKSSSLEDYLKSIKELFNLKSISITPLLGDLYKEALVDRNTCSFHVRVKLDRGDAIVSFYLNNPLELNDKGLLQSLERAGRLINLFIEGFEQKPQAKVIAV